MNGLTSCHWLTIFTLLSNITGSSILIEGLSQSNNSVIVIDLDHYCGVCPTNGLCPYFTELVHTQFGGGLMMDDGNQFQEKGFLTHSLQFRSYILLLKMRKPVSTESGIRTTGENMSKLISGSKRGNFSSSEPTSPTSVSRFQEQTHCEKTINASHLCVQRKLATSYICFDKMADYRVYQYDPNRKQFQGTGIKSSGKMRTAFLDVLTSLLYWSDSKGIKCACVDGGDVRTIILSRNVHDFTIDSKRGLIFYAYQHYGKSIIFCFNMNKKTKVLLLKAEGEIIMSINTEKQIMYWTNSHKKLLTLTYGRGEKESTYKLLNYKRNKIRSFSFVPDDSIIACSARVVILVNLKSRKSKRQYLKRNLECLFVQVINNQVHLLTSKGLNIFTMTGKLLDLIKYPTGDGMFLVKLH